MCTKGNCILEQRIIRKYVDILHLPTGAWYREPRNFRGTTVRLQYGIDGAGMHPGERHEGWLCFTTDIGEYKLPFLIQTEKAELKSAAGDVPDMDTFVEYCKGRF